MVSAAIEAFWKQLATSGMVQPDRIAELSRDFAASRMDADKPNVKDVVVWLIAQQVLSLEQCQDVIRRVNEANEQVTPPSPPEPPTAYPSPSVAHPTVTPPPLTTNGPSTSPAVAVDDLPRLAQHHHDRHRKNRTILVAAAAVAVLAVGGLGISFWMPNNEDPTAAPENEQATSTSSSDSGETGSHEMGVPIAAPPEQSGAEAITTTPAETPAPREVAVVDDGKTLWSSPTAGTSPTIRHVPSGTQLVFMIRPHEMLSTEAGRAILAALGPAGNQLELWIEAATGLKLDQLHRLDVMLGEPDNASSLLAVVAYPLETLDEQKRDASWIAARQRALATCSLSSRDLSYHFPADDRIVLASSTTIAEWQEVGEAGAPLPPPMTQLAESLDESRHCNILFATSYLRSARESLYGAYLAPLREGIDWMFGSSDEVQAGVLSVHIDDQLFAELRLFGVRDVLPRILARTFRERIDTTPRRVKDHLKTLSIHSYSRDVLWDFPDMLQSVAHYTRHDRDGRQGVVRCYLPARAAGHLVSAVELTLWETARGGAGDPRVPQATTGPAKGSMTLNERLSQTTSLSFDRNSLEKSLQTLSNDLGIRIAIIGRDLQLEGITKNQSFGIDLRDRPAREILNAIVQLANPDKTAKRLSDEAQKLVYVLKPKYKDGEDTIVITTRAQAIDRGDKLPPEFTTP